MRSALALLVAAALAGCGGSGATSSSTVPPSHGQTILPPPGRGVPQPAGPATLTVNPSTVSPGATITVTLRAPRGTRQAVVTLATSGATVTARATPNAEGFTARLVVPRAARGGFWPVVARYGAASPSRSATTQVKVFTP